VVAGLRPPWINVSLSWSSYTQQCLGEGLQHSNSIEGGYHMIRVVESAGLLVGVDCGSHTFGSGYGFCLTQKA
jgi:nitrogenase subunit NifH